MKATKAITSFQGPYRFLSNFWPAYVYLRDTLPDGPYVAKFPSVEHAYQAAKTQDRLYRQYFLSGTAGDAKRRGRRILIRGDWHKVKLCIMRELVTEKFKAHVDLRSLLLATGEAELIEGNTWGDTFWGMCDGVGHNHLGRILMDVRAGLRT